MLYDVDPDELEIRIRYVCGALLGLVLGLFLCLHLWPTTKITCVAVVAASVGLTAVLARHFGDSFWIAFLNPSRGGNSQTGQKQTLKLSRPRCELRLKQINYREINEIEIYSFSYIGTGRLRIDRQLRPSTQNCDFRANRMLARPDSSFRSWSPGLDGFLCKQNVPLLGRSRPNVQSGG